MSTWLLSCLILVVSLAPPALPGQEHVELIFLDVGQGDAAVVRSPEGKVAVIDGGPGGRIVGQLRARGIDSVDIVIASHAHADHIGGLESVIRSIPVRYYVDNGLPHTTATYLNLMNSLQQSGITYLSATERSIELGSVSLRIMPPPGGNDHNNNSVGIVVAFGAFTALFTGDSEVDELNHFLARGVPDVTVLKAAHHGSRDAVTPAWLAATKPDVVVISCGLDNQYGHPHAWALRYYQAVASEIYRTDQHGEVTIRGTRDGKYEIFTRATVSTRTQLTARPTAPPPAPPPTTAEIGLWVFADAPGNDHHNLNGEYVVVRNHATQRLAIGRWTLCDANGACFAFPPEAAIAGGDSVIVYTGSGVADGRRFFMSFRRAVWNNRGDIATLYDANRRPVAQYAY